MPSKKSSKKSSKKLSKKLKKSSKKLYKKLKKSSKKSQNGGSPSEEIKNIKNEIDKYKTTNIVLFNKYNELLKKIKNKLTGPIISNDNRIKYTALQEKYLIHQKKIIINNSEIYKKYGEINKLIENIKIDINTINTINTINSEKKKFIELVETNKNFINIEELITEMKKLKIPT